MNQQDKFEAYHAAHPEIYSEYERLTLQLIEKGRTHYSSDGILHIIRFNTAIRGGDGFKINNSYSPDYARMFEANNPQYVGFFEKRVRKAA